MIDWSLVGEVICHLGQRLFRKRFTPYTIIQVNIPRFCIGGSGTWQPLATIACNRRYR